MNWSKIRLISILVLPSLALLLSSLSVDGGMKDLRVNCMDKLRHKLIQRLQSADEPKDMPSESISLKEIETLYQKRNPAYGVPGKLLKLQNAKEGRPLLKKMLKDENELVTIEAAAVLAVLGFRDGLKHLQNVRSLSNSNIEFFYAKAALILLGEPVPEKLKDRNSIFHGLNDLLRPCSKNPSTKTYETGSFWKLEITESGNAKAIGGKEIWKWTEKVSYPERVLFLESANLFGVLGALGDSESGLGELKFFSINGSRQSQISLRAQIPDLETLSKAYTKEVGTFQWISSANFIRSTILELDVCNKKRVWIDPVSGHTEVFDLLTQVPSRSILEAQGAKRWRELQASGGVKDMDFWRSELSSPFPENGGGVSYYVYATNTILATFARRANDISIQDSSPFAKIRVEKVGAEPKVISIATTVTPYPMSLVNFNPENWTRYQQKLDRVETEFVQEQFQKRKKLSDSIRTHYCIWIKLHSQLAQAIRPEQKEFFDSLRCPSQ